MILLLRPDICPFPFGRFFFFSAHFGLLKRAPTLNVPVNVMANLWHQLQQTRLEHHFYINTRWICVLPQDGFDSGREKYQCTVTICIPFFSPFVAKIMKRKYSAAEHNVWQCQGNENAL